MKSKRENVVKRLCSARYAVSLLIMVTACILMPAKQARAAETSTIRVISTTDIHEQLANQYYDIAGEHNTGSLAQAFTLIKQARAEIVTGTSVTVDCGDTIYGYSGHYLADNYRTKLNSMYKAFREIDYDCITMGNHDFDMGVDYLREQLEMSGLDDVTVCANVYDAITKKPIWQQNIIVEEEIKTSKGRKVNIKIGFVGVTRPALSNFYSHKEILTTTDILSETRIQAKALKEQGADIIVAVAHSGIGTDSPDELSTDTCYAISKLKNIDVVMGGHIHVNFPSSNGDVQKYYELPNVDQETGLMNGKSVIIVADRGAGIGVADLQIRITKNGKVKIDDRTSEIRYTARTTPYDEAVMQYQPEFDSILKETYKEEIAPLADEETLNNFFAAVQDNAAMQIVNEAKIQFGMEYINANAAASGYQNYPVIAVSAFMNAGGESGSDYLNASGKITMGDVLRMEAYGGNYASIYTITGAQLREWLEWAASGYQQTGTIDATYADEYIRDNQSVFLPLLQSGWSTNWKHLYTFDGVEYDIDVSQPARYDYYGNKISNGKRIVKLTCNGVDVADTQNFLLVSDLMTQNPIVGGIWTTDCKIERTDTRSYMLVIDYLKNLTSFGALLAKADNNWRLLASSESSYIIKSGIGSLDLAKKQSWYRDTLLTTDQYAYYRASIATADMAGPTLVVNQEIKIETHRDVPVRIQATDVSGIASCKYLKGKYAADAEEWEQAEIISGSRFEADANGTYSVLAIDNNGNRTVKYIDINVIDRSILQVPSIDKLNNRINVVTGTSEVDSWVYLMDGDGNVYVDFTDENGRFSIDIPYQPGGSEMTVYTMDTKGRKSKKQKITVKRTGSNYPSVHSITNTTTEIAGQLNDTNCMMVAEVDGTVYVPKKGGAEAYRGSNNYDGLYTVVEVPYSTAGNNFCLKIPAKATGKDVRLYSIDYIGRISAKQTIVVSEAAPNKPTVYEVSDADGYVYGRAKTSVQNAKAIVTVAGKKYEGTIDEQGYFTVQVAGLKAGKEIKVQATDTVDGVTRKSVVTKTTVESYTKFEEDKAFQNITMNTVTDKSYEIRGTVTPDADLELYIRIGDKQAYKVSFDENGKYELLLNKTIAPGTKIYATMRYVYDGIDEVICETVKKAVPDEPAFVDDITDKTDRIDIVSEKDCTVVVKIGKKTYTQSKGVYREKYDGYVYKVKVEPPKANNKVVVFAKNSAGRSTKIRAIVEKTKKKKKGDKGTGDTQAVG